jgi:hypothetical protein
MAGQLRPNKKAMKIVYAILKTPKDKRQNAQKQPSLKLQRQWYVDQATAQ